MLPGMWMRSLYLRGFPAPMNQKGSTERISIFPLVRTSLSTSSPGNALGYVAGVMIQSRTVRGYDQPALAARLASDTGWLDLTNPQLRRILAMLKTHLRRKS